MINKKAQINLGKLTNKKNLTIIVILLLVYFLLFSNAPAVTGQPWVEGFRDFFNGNGDDDGGGDWWEGDDDGLNCEEECSTYGLDFSGTYPMDNIDEGVSCYDWSVGTCTSQGLVAGGSISSALCCCYICDDPEDEGAGGGGDEIPEDAYDYDECEFIAETLEKDYSEIGTGGVLFDSIDDCNDYAWHYCNEVMGKGLLYFDFYEPNCCVWSCV